jgi:hypothetical protein
VYRKKLTNVLPKSSSRALHESEGDNILITNLKETKRQYHSSALYGTRGDGTKWREISDIILFLLKNMA